VFGNRFKSRSLHRWIPPARFQSLLRLRFGRRGRSFRTDDALRFAELRGVRAMIETYPLGKAAEAYARMMSGNAEFRVVLTM
jgi:hypothetical protein